MKEKSSHILNASSNLLGFCLIIITSMKISKIDQSSYIDEFAGLASLFLVTSCFLSFLSIRNKNSKSSDKYEKIADYLFLSALVCITLAVVFVSANFMQ